MDRTLDYIYSLLKSLFVLCCSSENVKCLWDVTINLMKVIINRKCQDLFGFCFSCYVRYLLAFPLQDCDTDFELCNHMTRDIIGIFGKRLSNLISWALPNVMASSLTVVTPYTHAMSNSVALGSLIAMPLSPFFAFLTPSHILVLGIWGKRHCNLVIKRIVFWARMSGVQSELHYLLNVWPLQASLHLSNRNNNHNNS